MAIRLNIIAGHIFLTLLGNSGEIINSHLILILIIIGQTALFILELSVSIIPVCYNRITKNHFSKYHHFGFEARA